MKIKRKDNLDNLSSLENNIARLYRYNIIQPLKGFCRVVEEGSLSRAAEKYSVTPGLLTKQIKVIENQLGVELFNRDNNCRIFPNEAGLKFYDKASKIITQLENLVIEFNKEMADEENKILRIGTSPVMLNKLIPFISKFENENKLVRVDFIVKQKSEMFDLLADNKIDVVLCGKENSEHPDIRLQFRKLVEYKPFLVLYKGHPLENVEKLTKDDVINANVGFSFNDITMTSLKNFIVDNNIRSSIYINRCDVDTQKKLIKNKICAGILFNIFLTKEDCEYLIFKDVSHLFSIGKYGYYINNVRKDITNKFVKSLETNSDEIFDLKFLES